VGEIWQEFVSTENTKHFTGIIYDGEQKYVESEDDCLLYLLTFTCLFHDKLR